MTTPQGGIDWPTTREMFGRGFRSSLHSSIATVDRDGAPHIAPIGPVMLTKPGRDVFFDVFTSQLSQNLDRGPRVCVMAVDSGKRFWLASLARGRFGDHPAVRLTGTARRPRRTAALATQSPPGPTGSEADSKANERLKEIDHARETGSQKETAERPPGHARRRC